MTGYVQSNLSGLMGGSTPTFDAGDLPTAFRSIAMSAWHHFEIQQQTRANAYEAKNMIKILSLTIISIVSTAAISEGMPESYRPREGYVSSEKTAKAIAEAVLIPIYGIDEISRQKPFKVALNENKWIVQGSTPADRGVRYFGGNFTIHIVRTTGEITHVSHSK